MDAFTLYRLPQILRMNLGVEAEVIWNLNRRPLILVKQGLLYLGLSSWTKDFLGRLLPMLDLRDLFVT